MRTIEVREYRRVDGYAPFSSWVGSLRDRQARSRIALRVLRLQAGLRGDWRAVGAGVIELRVDFGPGYRIYCAQDGRDVVLLLCGGDKRTQARDIEVAHEYWKDYQGRRAKPAVSRGGLSS